MHAGIPPPGSRHPQSRHPPPTVSRHPPWEQTPREQTAPPGADTPQRRACWEIRSTRGRYAFYLNAILFFGVFFLQITRYIYTAIHKATGFTGTIPVEQKYVHGLWMEAGGLNSLWRLFRPPAEHSLGLVNSVVTCKRRFYLFDKVSTEQLITNVGIQQHNVMTLINQHQQDDVTYEPAQGQQQQVWSHDESYHNSSQNAASIHEKVEVQTWQQPQQHELHTWHQQQQHIQVLIKALFTRTINVTVFAPFKNGFGAVLWHTTYESTLKCIDNADYLHCRRSVWITHKDVSLGVNVKVRNYADGDDGNACGTHSLHSPILALNTA